MGPHLAPVFSDDVLVVAQDAELAVPGFYVVGIKEHVGSIDALNEAIAQRLSYTVRTVRQCMREALGVEYAHTYQEEKLSGSHYHVWLVPLWLDVMQSHGLNPRIWESNVREYLEVFDFAMYGDTILKFNDIMRGRLSALMV